ncbi:MAG: xanthine dehydrogenase family protein molybdopterin-binding subunit [Dehalococcoidia bacterium]|nr:xanthine dehydrogenase family protein molybdopterin-binding subunit [Dehalococcoidia bacterium]MDW8119661.1 xanthine dehydrogenase family protein molybdopterin-binding subunit [Chloroflexota bacterium]
MTTTYRYIGKPVPKADALERVTGTARYGADLKLPGMLYGKVLRSPHPHAIIRRIDASRALALEGVKAVVTSADLPPLEDARAAFGGELMIDLDHLRRLTIAHDKALFEGHAIAAVAATAPEIAEAALELIQVDYEVLPVVDTALDAMKPDAPLLHPNLYTRTLGEKPTKPSNIATIVETGFGDLEKAWAEADVVVEQSFETQMVHQGYLEPQACVAWVDANGKINVWTTTQGTFNAQRMLSALLKVPLHQINVIPAEIGGGFGGKIYVILEPLAILLSRKAGRPVKMVMDRAEVFRATGPGSPAYITVKAGAKKDGRLTGLYGKIIMDAGAFPGAPIQGATWCIFAPYKAPAMKVEAYDVVTNKPRVQAYRAPGGTVVAFAAESVLDMLAERLGMDPVEFRLRNVAEEGDQNVTGQKYGRIGAKAVLEAVQNHPHWNTPLQGKNRGRGMAMGAWMGAILTSSSQVIVNVDGTVNIVTGQVDLTGTRTTMMQMVADMLQIPLEQVSIRVADTDSAPYTDLSAGSRSTFTQSAALARACQSVIAQMKAQAAEALSKPDRRFTAQDIEYAEGKFWVRSDPELAMPWRQVASLTRTRGTGPIVGTGTVTRLQPANEFAAQVCDVEVDPETGKVKILRFTAFQDAGKAINPVQVEGQMQGGAVQGIGWGLFEYYAWDKGKLRNPTLLDYREPTALDVPMIDTCIVEVPAPDGPLGVRGVGEPPIVPGPAALANAIYRAVGVRMTKLPMTPEAVFWAIQEKKRAHHPQPIAANGGSG